MPEVTLEIVLVVTVVIVETDIDFGKSFSRHDNLGVNLTPRKFSTMALYVNTTRSTGEKIGILPPCNINFLSINSFMYNTATKNG